MIQGGITMVKGISKRAILVKTLPNTMFEEAIFFLREDATNDGIDADELIREAYSAAISCSKRESKRISKKAVVATTFTVLGASLVGIVWMLCTII